MDRIVRGADEGQRVEEIELHVVERGPQRDGAREAKRASRRAPSWVGQEQQPTLGVPLARDEPPIVRAHRDKRVVVFLAGGEWMWVLAHFPVGAVIVNSFETGSR